MKKQALIKGIIDQLGAELELYYRAARAAHAEATHEQSKAENKYDTRGLEASYLARGQARQAAELEYSIEQFKALAAPDFSDGRAVEVGALVELESKGERTFYFVGPCAGGTEIVQGRNEVMVITPQSPLGRQLMGKTEGAKFDLNQGNLRNGYRIVKVS